MTFHQSSGHAGGHRRPEPEPDGIELRTLFGALRRNKWLIFACVLIAGAIAVTALKSTRPSYCLLYTSPSPRDQRGSRMPSSA